VLTQDPTADTAGFRLSPQQEQLWRGEPDGPRLVAQGVIDISAADPPAVRSALGRIVARHEILRTTFARQPGVKLPAQVIHDELQPDWTEISVATDAELAELVARDAASPFDLVRGPIVRGTLVEHDGSRRLLVTLPSVCADAPTIAIVAEELRTLLAGAEPSPSEPLQYADYAEWRSESLREDDATPAAWDFDELPPSPRLPDVRDDDAVLRVPVALVTADADRGAAACNVDTAVFLEACWHACIARLTGDDEVVVGAVLDGRTHDELEGAAGPFSQVFPLETTIDVTTTVAELVDGVGRGRARLARSQNSADGATLEEAAARCAIGFSAVGPAAGAGLERVTGAPAPFVAELSWLADGDRSQAELRIAADADAAGLVAGTLAAVVAAAAADTSLAVLDLPLSLDDAPGTTLSVFFGPPSLAPDATAADLFEQRAGLHPDRIALVASGIALSYAELNARANQVAHRLRSIGVGSGANVGLCLERSAHSIVAVLGTLKAGGAYVPLNVEHPAARLVHQLTESEAAVLLAETSVADRLPDFGGTTILLDDDSTGLAAEPDGNAPPSGSGPDDLAYVMYTSGSTGTPKGVGVTNANLVNYTTAILDRLGIAEEGAVFAAVSALSTDLGNTSIFPSLLGGGTLHLVSPAESIDGALFAAYLEAHPIDVLKITPSLLRALVAGAEVESVLPRRWLVLGGEALSWQFVDRLTRAGATCRILNHYGPTETTIGTCTFEPGAGERHGDTVPVGAPLSGTRAYILDRALRPLPAGIPGELAIGGAGVARGYVGRPDQTAASFPADPVGGAGRIYRTGDRARALPDGNIEFLGRLDDQVKIRGYRVEPGEIEAALALHPSVRECAVVARKGADDELELVAYLVGGDASPEELQSFLRESLPAYMVPQRFARLDALPFTPSGKIDRRALPDPGESDRAVEYVAPRTPLEEGLAEIWQELLGVERVGVNDDFFALGGHSLLATQAVIRIRNAFAEIPLHSLFNAPTVAGLAEAIVNAELEAGEASVPSGGAAA
jgi:amino acid adenylation domain-containing protein